MQADFPSRPVDGSHSVRADSLDTRDCGLPCLSVHGISRQEYWAESRSPALQADSLPYEPPGEPPQGLYNSACRGHYQARPKPQKRRMEFLWDAKVCQGSIKNAR